MIGRNCGRIKAAQFQAAVAIGRAHHGNFNALATHPRDTAGPFAIDGHSALKAKAQFGEELNGPIEVFHHDTDVVQALEGHGVYPAV